MKLRKFIKTTIREYLNEQIKNSDTVWYHGTDKEFLNPKRFVGEFDNMGGFF